jgi:DNA-binding transcriptional ArsR family regulator
MPLDETLNALRDPTRREILRLLRRRDMTAGEIAARFPLARSTLSSHLNVLKDAGLAVYERQGTSLVYSLNLSVVEETMAAVVDLLSARTREGRQRRRRAREVPA